MYNKVAFRTSVLALENCWTMPHCVAEALPAPELAWFQVYLWEGQERCSEPGHSKARLKFKRGMPGPYVGCARHQIRHKCRLGAQHPHTVLPDPLSLLPWDSQDLAKHISVTQGHCMDKA